MRLAVATFLAALAASTAAQASSRLSCTHAPGDYVGGPNAYMMWADIKPGPRGGFAYDDAGLTCAPKPHVHAWRRHRWRHARVAYRAPRWVNVPIANVGGLCPRGHCGLLDTGAHQHYREWLAAQEGGS